MVAFRDKLARLNMPQRHPKRAQDSSAKDASAAIESAAADESAAAGEQTTAGERAAAIESAATGESAGAGEQTTAGERAAAGKRATAKGKSRRGAPSRVPSARQLPVAERLAQLRAALGRMLGDAGDGPQSTQPQGAQHPSAQRQQHHRARGAAAEPGVNDVQPPSSGELPVERRLTPWGELDMARSEWTPDACMGRVRVGDLIGADMEQLALLGHTPELTRLRAGSGLFLDTESTGFGTGTGNYAFLVGACHYQPERGCFVLEQVLLRDPEDEPRMLSWLSARIEDASYLVTYNGKSFDLPLLRGRSVMCRKPPLSLRPHLDLLHTARRVHRHRNFRKTLGELEKRALGFERGPDISGAEVAERYLRYLHHRRDETLVNVVSHNTHDVMSLVALAALYGGPIEALAGEEAAAVAHTLWRQRSLARARRAADLALSKGTARADALRASAFIYKVRGDKHAAIDHFEQLAEMGDAQARLELAKLYEHFLKDFTKALNITRLGTIERPAEHAHRLARLERKQTLAELSPRYLLRRPSAHLAGCRAD